MKALYVMSLVILLVSYMSGCTATRPAVSEASIDEFLEAVGRQSFHEIARTGDEIFEQGRYIPNHTALFVRFPSSVPKNGHVRYVFHSFRGPASIGEIYLILESDTGRIVEFNHVEAWFE